MPKPTAPNKPRKRKSPHKKEHLSTSEAAARLGITESLVRRYIRHKKLKAERIGERSYAIKESDLETFAATR